MTYPEKYPNGFMAAAIKADEQGNILKRNLIFLEAIQHFSDLIRDAMVGLLEADASFVLASFAIYCNSLRSVTPDNGKLADELVDKTETRMTITRMPSTLDYGDK